MANDKIFEIEGVKFTYRDPNEFNMDEDELVQNFFSTAYAADKNTIACNATAEQKEKLLKVILIPQSELPADFSFRKANRGITAEIIAGFFLLTVLSTMNTINSLRDLITGQAKQ